MNGLKRFGWLRRGYRRHFALLIAGLPLLSPSGPTPAWGSPPPVLPPTSGAATYQDAQFPWRQLTWDDFRVDDVQKGLAAETVSYLRFRYRTHIDQYKAPDGTNVYTATITQITFSGGFDKTHSWRRSVVQNHPALLNHEQGHLDLNEIKRRQLQALPLTGFPVGRGESMLAAASDLSQRMGEWFRGEVFSLRTRQTEYDAETNHGTNTKPQKRWSEQIDREIALLPALS